ncbi:MAG: F0F1 ATP synthase subunit alpha, partial [Bdellovibrionaceae bacterium]|nr:F0F1 ATP synthase subunit alpha [Pseudobdellovibrionaceae bacterium]
SEMCIRDRYMPYDVSEQVASIWVATNGYLDDISEKHVAAFEKGFLDYLKTKHSHVLKSLSEKKAITDEIKAGLKTAADEYKLIFKA